jgi:hypothetical protein
MDRNNLVEGMDFNGNHDLSFYHGCVYCKYHRAPFPLNEDSCAKEILGCVHINLCDPMATSHVGVKYFLTFIDDFSWKTFFYAMKTKFGVLDKLKVLKVSVKNQTKKNIKVIMCDGSAKCNFKKFNTLYNDNSIVKQTTTPYTLEQNGVIKKKN